MAAKRWRWVSAVILMLANTAMAVEEPAFRPILREGHFELRDYPALVVAEVTVTGQQKEAANKGFRLLARYIFGANKQRHGIPMTAPVTQQATSEKIAMTAPVAQTPTTAGQWVVRFTMPSAYTLQTLPVPDDPRVHLRTTAPVRVAVLRFSGLAQPDDVAAKSRELLAEVKARHLRAIGPVSLAQYNPPWTLWFLRRNEVMVDVER